MPAVIILSDHDNVNKKIIDSALRMTGSQPIILLGEPTAYVTKAENDGVSFIKAEEFLIFDGTKIEHNSNAEELVKSVMRKPPESIVIPKILRKSSEGLEKWLEQLNRKD